jgi:hypothetical protein
VPTLGLETTSDKDGRFAFEGIAVAGLYRKATIEVTGLGFGKWALQGAAVRPNGNTLRLTVELLTYAQDLIYTPPEERPPNAGPQPAENPSAGPPTSLSSCSGFSSNHWPPPRIRVWRKLAGESFVRIYNFKYYAKNVLPNEWTPSWDSDALTAGAVAVENYGWYWVNNWRGGTAPNGECYDVNDDPAGYQLFVPGTQYASTDSAVNLAWNWMAKKSGGVFEGRHWSGDPYEACGVGANGVQMRQWGTRQCALDGMGWKQIVTTYYYPNVKFQFIKTDFSGDSCSDVLFRENDGTLDMYRGNCANGFIGTSQIGSGWGSPIDWILRED